MHEMNKIRIIAPRSYQSDIIEALHREKVLHITEKNLEGTELGKPLRQAEQLSDAQIKLRAICAKLNIDLPEESTVYLRYWMCPYYCPAGPSTPPNTYNTTVTIKGLEAGLGPP